jgi:hypothetical protein
VVAITASGTVASWSLWEDWKLAWKLLSSTAAFVSIVTPVLGLRSRIEAMQKVCAAWVLITPKYEELWRRLNETTNSAEIEREFNKTRIETAKLEAEEIRLPKHKKLLRRCQCEVLRRRKLN